jgi:hypothetical protein
MDIENMNNQFVVVMNIVVDGEIVMDLLIAMMNYGLVHTFEMMHDD